MASNRDRELSAYKPGCLDVMGSVSLIRNIMSLSTFYLEKPNSKEATAEFDRIFGQLTAITNYSRAEQEKIFAKLGNALLNKRIGELSADDKRTIKEIAKIDIDIDQNDPGKLCREILSQPITQQAGAEQEKAFLEQTERLHNPPVGQNPNELEKIIPNILNREALENFIGSEEKGKKKVDGHVKGKYQQCFIKMLELAYFVAEIGFSSHQQLDQRTKREEERVKKNKEKASDPSIYTQSSAFDPLITLQSCSKVITSLIEDLERLKKGDITPGERIEIRRAEESILNNVRQVLSMVTKAQDYKDKQLLKMDVKDKEAEVKRLEQSNQEKLVAVNQAIQAKENLKKSMQELEQTLRQRNSQLQEANRKIETLGEEKERFKDHYEIARQWNTHYQSEIKGKDEKLAGQDKTIGQLTSNNNQLQGENKDLKEQVTAMLATIERRKEENSKLEQDKKSLGEAVTAKDQMITSLTSNNQALQQELTKLKTQAPAPAASSPNTEHQKALNQAKAQFEQEKKSLQAESQGLKAELEALKKQMNAPKPPPLPDRSRAAFSQPPARNEQSLAYEKLLNNLKDKILGTNWPLRVKSEFFGAAVIMHQGRKYAVPTQVAEQWKHIENALFNKKISPEQAFNNIQEIGERAAKNRHNTRKDFTQNYYENFRTTESAKDFLKEGVVLQQEQASVKKSK